MGSASSSTSSTSAASLTATSSARHAGFELQPQQTLAQLTQALGFPGWRRRSGRRPPPSSPPWRRRRGQRGVKRFHHVGERFQPLGQRRQPDRRRPGLTPSPRAGVLSARG
ncbi:MAG: hypothetical protein WDM85_03190 [Caulobacteraceae bacterium]